MLSSKIISFCRDKGWWFDDVEPAYRDALLKIGFDISSDFSLFYLHVEDGPTFISKNGEIYQDEDGSRCFQGAGVIHADGFVFGRARFFLQHANQRGVRYRVGCGFGEIVEWWLECSMG